MRVPVLALLVLAAPAAAQFTSPGGLANRPGYTTAYYGIGYRSTTAPQSKLLQVHDDVPGMTISSISFRRNSSESYWYTVPAYKVEVEIDMSTAATTASTISNTYATNHGTNKVNVFTRKFVSLPAVPHLPIRPQLPLYIFPFDTKFTHTANTSLCWELKCHTNDLDQQGTVYNYLDRAYQPTSATSSHYGFATYYGWGCRGSQTSYYQPYTYLYAAKVGANVNTYMYTYYLSPGGSAVFLIGTKSQDLDLGAIGAPGCLLSVVPAAAIPYTPNSTGYARFPASGNLTFPWSASMEGVPLFAQSAGLDKRANSLGIVTSRAYQRDLPTVYANGLPAGQVYSNGSSAIGATTGSRYNYYATITRFN